MKGNNTARLQEKPKSLISNGVNIVGFILIMMSGCIDAVSVKLFLLHSPTFMTGRAAKLGYAAFSVDLKAFWSIAIVVIAFILGACLSTIITRKTGLMGGCFLQVYLL